MLYLLWAQVGAALPHFARPPFNHRVTEHSDDHDKQEVAGVHQVQVDEGAVIVRHDDGELWVERVVQLPHGSLVAPEGVVVLAVLGVRVADRSEHFVPGGGVGERLRDAVRRLHCDGEDVAGCSDGHARAEHHLLTVSVQHTLV